MQALVSWLGRSCRAPAVMRLRALFCLHAPPLLPAAELQTQHVLPTGEEVATDAAVFFDRYGNVIIFHILQLVLKLLE